MMLSNFDDYKLLVVIVKRGLGSKVIKYSKEKGGKGGTIIPGKGTVNKEICENILGIKFEIEKEVVLLAVHKTIKDIIIDTIYSKLNLNKIGSGICFTLNLKQVGGISHLLNINKEV